jgi:glycerophosphoryl diester phosphodiesterase
MRKLISLMRCSWFFRANLHALLFVVIISPTFAHALGLHNSGIQLGLRPYYLLQGMEEGQLRDMLMQCQNGPFRKTDFSLAHRGAALQFPEHSDVAYEAGARMGAGIVECDVTFTKDGELVCRHSECDLHTTTDIVARADLNAKCTVPWTGPDQSPAVQCCTSDLTLDEFRALRPKMDGSNPSATTSDGYMAGTESWRTDLYTGHGNLVTFKESISINQRNGVKHAPELKEATYPDRVNAIFGSQAGYAKKFIDTLVEAGVKPKDVYAQSFSLNDVIYWD